MQTKKKKTAKKVAKKTQTKLSKKKASTKSVKSKKKVVLKKVFIKKKEVKEKIIKLKKEKLTLPTPALIEIIEPTTLSEDKINKDAAELEKKKKIYWSEDTEEAVVDFLKNDLHFNIIQFTKYKEECLEKGDQISEAKILYFTKEIDRTSLPETKRKRDSIYKERIQKPLNKLVENIIFNFKLLRPGVDLKEIHDDCVSFVFGKFANFNPSKNAKSFSYFGTIAKHYLQGEKKEEDKSTSINLDYDFNRDKADSVETYQLDDVSDLDTSLTLFGHVIFSIEKELDKGQLTENDMKVGDAIISIFKNHESLDAYNKNHIYQLIKENTGLQTKDITYSLQRFRVFYRLLKQDFIKEERDDFEENEY